MQTLLTQFNKHLLSPCEVSGAPLDAEDDIKREKENGPVLQEVIIQRATEMRVISGEVA